MVIKKCDVCKTEVDALYDREITTHIDTINGTNYLQKEKLHICRTCMASVNEAVNTCELGWYEDNVKGDNVTPGSDTSDEGNNEPNNESNENNEQNSGDAEGPTVGE